MYKAGFRKGRETKGQTANIRWMRKKQGFPEKHLLLFHDYVTAFDYVNHNELWKILKEVASN